MNKCLAAEHISRETVLRRVERCRLFCHKCLAKYRREKSVFWRACTGECMHAIMMRVPVRSVFPQDMPYRRPSCGESGGMHRFAVAVLQIAVHEKVCFGGPP